MIFSGVQITWIHLDRKLRCIPAGNVPARPLLKTRKDRSALTLRAGLPEVCAEGWFNRAVLSCPRCGPAFLAWEASRLPRILEELRLYDADVLCFQDDKQLPESEVRLGDAGQ